ncbi:MAG TPA: threonine synthase [Rhodospirillales bacterium]|nr:threonine synthase [Rhodospirillales bacterium]
MAHVSTRGGAGRRGFEEVLLAGLAEDGGLFLPEQWPRFSREALAELNGLSYPETATRLLRPFVEDCFDEAELAELCARAYAGFAHAATAPLVQIAPDDWLLELFHGPTLAFKDFALQLLGLMFERVLARRGRSITIVGATSGDTGSAAIHAVAGRANMRIVVLHPHERVSAVQRRQMTTVDADNVFNIAVRGTFDDCQALVKAMFADAAFRREQDLAAVNSINWARILAQTVYYVHAALRLGGLERPPVFAVPTGNFGDVYAGYVARRIGLPVRRLIVATNRNDILARFFETGVYRLGEVVPTVTPSMDIQVASNFERLLFDLEDGDGARVRRALENFAKTGELAVEPERMARLGELFRAGRATEEETRAAIRRVFEESGQVVDPHTAVGVEVGRRLRRPGEGPLVCLATAHPAKFPETVTEATGRRPTLPPHLADLMTREERFVVLDADLAAVQEFVRRTGRA